MNQKEDTNFFNKLKTRADKEFLNKKINKNTLLKIKLNHLLTGMKLNVYNDDLEKEIKLIKQLLNKN